MSSIKALTLYGDGGINPTKVRFALIVLSIPHQVEHVPFATIKDKYYTGINPNGRLPALHDPNTDITIWESNAIIEYLVETYDTKHEFSFPQGSKEAYQARQWSYFQSSGQGPYFGQASWFKLFSPEKVPLAEARYAAEVNRVDGVLDAVLKQKREAGEAEPWLVGGKFSYVDLLFIPWQKMMAMVLTKEEHDLDKFEELKGWFDRMEKREDIQAGLKTMKKLE